MQESIRAVTSIRKAISKFGYPDPSGAYNFLGDLNWQIVLNMGGWNAICFSEDTIEFHEELILNARAIINREKNKYKKGLILINGGADVYNNTQAG